ncbi:MULTISPECIES: hypothetical protein [Streptomyces]|uniref:Transposase IS4-like domain-containing protein n=1 Tax=Streptomyces cadmiisoli TaxID=2184053 RepID=A0A2Z4JDP9_9ACTN|nr:MULTISPECIES: hypothetical protein [Streptomyces]AWW43249.1 hypothetical protein DN051_42430 [Streptomyces cadmiisoli]
MTLVETGTRAVIAAVFGPTREGETSYANRLLHHLSPEMLVLWDRGFDSNDFLTAAHATGAQVLGRIPSAAAHQSFKLSPTPPTSRSSAASRCASSKPR